MYWTGLDWTSWPADRKAGRTRFCSLRTKFGQGSNPALDRDVLLYIMIRIRFDTAEDEIIQACQVDE